jgi:hypothetical protein
LANFVKVNQNSVVKGCHDNFVGKSKESHAAVMQFCMKQHIVARANFM